MRDALLDPWLGPHWKGLPPDLPRLRRSEVAAQGWHALAGDLPLPLAIIRRDALDHNLGWLQQRATEWGVALAPHGKTTLSPQLFRRQIEAGAWGITVATVGQAALAAAAGVRRLLIANQVLADADLAALRRLLDRQQDLRCVFLVDSLAQLALVDAWAQRHPRGRSFEALLEIGFDGGRTGCRTHAQALALAEAMHASAAVCLVGVECYEGLRVSGDEAADHAFLDALMDRVDAVLRDCDARGWFAQDEVLVSAGGSAIYDQVAQRLRPTLSRPVRGVLRSGCYLTHDHGFYARVQQGIDRRLHCDAGESLRPALEVWATVQSCPEPGLALLAVGKRDLSYDLGLPVPVARAPRGSLQPQAAPPQWRVEALNDQHAYLRWNPAAEAAAAPPVVGERVGLGISHPCTTFDKWRWMPLVDADYRVVDAIVTHF